MVTGYGWLELFGWHDTGTFAGFRAPSAQVQPHQHFESAESKTRLASLIEVSGLLPHLRRLDIEPATETDILRVHSLAHLDRIKASSAQLKGGDAGDGQSPFANGGYEIALMAAGATSAAVDAVVTGAVDNAYALVRPPGHHALRDTGMGFCMFANIAVAIERARGQHGVQRVAVVDWDVHHGNGTQEIFYHDRDVLTISVHQDHLFPHEGGDITERGDGDALGAALNIPLPAGSGNGAYEEALRRVVVPALRAFSPDLIVVACGFDAGMNDPLGRMIVTAEGYRNLADILLDTAATICDGRLVMSHEGGYSPTYVPYCGLAVLEAMSGHDTGWRDPLSGVWEAMPDQAVKPHQLQVIDAAAALVLDIPHGRRK